ncbi:MAG: LLM class F420-dependent oxidoreductase [Thaumarchaeota archaeon]|nr:LLM class F420-dependent oxidoreductase [Candidatus Calditenuaceae archaeon]MDW8187273.1 LLM class F420-dependent oxidoreductase [Nitrososphaerota archaeon]
MRVGLCIPNFGKNLSREGVLSSALEAERLGYDSIWVTDHVAIGASHPYPYGRTYEALTTLSYLAGKTESIKLGTSVIVTPLRNAVLVAKQIATLDVLTEGRLIVGIGAGWEPTEFRAMGADFRSRGRLLDEQLKLIKALWSGKAPDFVGEFHKVVGVLFSPAPHTSNGPPVWVGGNSERAVRRALELADGWHFTGIPADELTERMTLVRSRARDGFVVSGRITVRLGPQFKSEEVRAGSGERRYVLGGKASSVADELSRLIRLGLQYPVVYLGDLEQDELLVKMREFINEVVLSIS